jgi:hypothetical protein
MISDIAQRLTVVMKILRDNIFLPYARHLGAYWDPGMEFGNEREEWDKPFSGNGIRVIKSRGFKITYPNYTLYYKDLDTMYQHIVQQNRDIMDFIHNNQRVKRIYDTIELQESLNLTPTGKFEYYKDRDIVVYVYR